MRMIMFLGLLKTTLVREPLVLPRGIEMLGMTRRTRSRCPPSEYTLIHRLKHNRPLLEKCRRPTKVTFHPKSTGKVPQNTCPRKWLYETWRMECQLEVRGRTDSA